MKIALTISALLFSMVVAPAFAQKPSEPLKQDQVTDLVKAGMDPKALTKLIHEHGIDFEMNDDIAHALIAAGASDAVIAALNAVKPPPISRSRLLALVAAGLPSGRIIDLVTTRGLSFYAGDDYLKTLRLAGADDPLVFAVRSISQESATNVDVATAANAEVFFDGDSAGHADAQGYLKIQTVVGSHDLKVTLAGKKDFQQRIAIEKFQSNRIEARLEDSAPGQVMPPYQTSPLIKEARDRVTDCFTMAQDWNMKRVGLLSNIDRTKHMTRQEYLDKVNAATLEGVEDYRKTLMPQLVDLQQKMLKAMGKSSTEQMDYTNVHSAIDLIRVCSNVNSLSSQYGRQVMEGNIK